MLSITKVFKDKSHLIRVPLHYLLLAVFVFISPSIKSIDMSISMTKGSNLIRLSTDATRIMRDGTFPGSRTVLYELRLMDLFHVRHIYIGRG